VEREIFGLGATAFIPKPDLLRAGRALEIVESALQRTSGPKAEGGTASSGRTPEAFDEIVDHLLEAIVDLFLEAGVIAGSGAAPPGGGGTLRATVRLGNPVSGSACLALPNLAAALARADAEVDAHGEVEAELGRVILERLRERSGSRVSISRLAATDEPQGGSATGLRLEGRILVPTLREEGELTLELEGWTVRTLSSFLGRLEESRHELVG
jgi:hypothetical protein